MNPFDLYDAMEAEWVWRDYLNGNPVSDSFGQILDRLVETKPKSRYQSVAEVWADLQPSSGTVPPSPPIKIPAQPKSNTFEFDMVAVNERGREINRRQGQAEYMVEDLGDGVNLAMVLIPGGTFIMGAPSSEKGSDDNERPQHRVTVEPFLMGKYPVTPKQWRQVASFPKLGRDLDPDPSKERSNLPVEKVSWYDAIEWCARLSKKIGKLYRLPSEAEWEYGARAGTTTPFHIGETLSTDLANYNGNLTYGSGTKGVYRQKTTPVGHFKHANAFGLYDIHGNVWEWCADPWHDNYNGAPTEGRVWDGKDVYDNYVDNLVNLINAKERRVLRGGSWNYVPVGCRCASRIGSDPDNFYNRNFGFRVACSVPENLRSLQR